MTIEAWIAASSALIAFIAAGLAGLQVQSSRRQTIASKGQLEAALRELAISEQQLASTQNQLILERETFEESLRQSHEAAGPRFRLDEAIIDDEHQLRYIIVEYVGGARLASAKIGSDRPATLQFATLNDIRSETSLKVGPLSPGDEIKVYVALDSWQPQTLQIECVGIDDSSRTWSRPISATWNRYVPIANGAYRDGRREGKRWSDNRPPTGHIESNEVPEK